MTWAEAALAMQRAGRAMAAAGVLLGKVRLAQPQPLPAARMLR